MFNEVLGLAQEVSIIEVDDESLSLFEDHHKTDSEQHTVSKLSVT